MKSISKEFIIGVLFLLSLTLSSCTNVLYIDFESYPGGEPTSVFDPIDTQFSSWGISHITSENDVGDAVPSVIAKESHYPVVFHSGVSALAPYPGAQLNPDPASDFVYGFAQAPIHVFFTKPISYFSVYAMDVGYNGLIVNAYDIDSNLIDSISIDGTGRDHSGIPGGDGFDFIEFTVPGISKISFFQIHDSDWDRANNLGFEGYLLDDIIR